MDPREQEKNALNLRSLKGERVKRIRRGGFGTGTKFLIVFGVFGVTVALYAAYGIFAATKQSVSLRTQQQLEDGLIAYWTFDGVDMGTSTAVDKSGNGNTAQMKVFPDTQSIGSVIGSSNAYTTAGTQSYSVPSNASFLLVKAWGGGGAGGSFDASASVGGGGGFISGYVPVTGGESVTIAVGGGGSKTANFTTDGGGGGGYSGLLRNGTKIMIAGGGGGGGGSTSMPGGAGGGATGVDGSGTNPGLGGSQTSGGAAGGGSSSAGSTLQGGQGANSGGGGSGGTNGGGAGGSNPAGVADGGGGGGGGWFGGGGGSDSGGGGGSSGADSGVFSITNTAGSGTTPANTGDSDYVASAGTGGASGTNGTVGRVVVYAYAAPSSATLLSSGSGRIGQSVDLDGTAEYVSGGNIGSGIKSIAFWMKADDTTSRKIINIDGTDQIELNASSVITATSFPGTTVIYVDGAVASTIRDTNWHHVVVTDTTGVNGSTFEIGRMGTSYFDGQIDDVRIYNKVLSNDDITRLYQQGGTTEINKTLATQPSIEQGLIDHWTFDGNAVDLSNNSGEILDRGSNNITGDWEKHASTTVQGKVGQAIHFDGVNDDINMGTSINFANQSFSIALWERLDISALTSNSQHHMIVQDDDGSGSNNNTLQVGIRGTGANSGRVTFAFFNNDLHTISREYGSTTNWYHIVATYNADTNDRRLYVNGVLENSDTAAADYSGSGLLCISRCAASPSSGTEFAGDIDDVRFYNRTLSAQEAADIYALGATSKINTTIESDTDINKGMVAWWPMDGKDIDLSKNTAEIKDRTGNGNTMDWQRHASTTAIGRIGQGLLINDSDDRAQVTSESTALENIFSTASTFSFWIKPTSLGNGGTLETIFCEGVLGTGRYTGVATNSNGKIEFYADFSGGTRASWFWNNSVVLATSTWTHIVITYDGSSTSNNAVLYANGVLQNQTAANPSTGTFLTHGSDPFSIGSCSASDATNFSAVLDDIRLYNRTLNRGEIKKLYDLGK